MGGLAGMWLRGDSFSLAGGSGLTWGFLAGLLGATGAFGLTLSMFAGGARIPHAVMPVVFGGAVTVGPRFRPCSSPAAGSGGGPLLWLGIAGMLLSNRPHHHEHAARTRRRESAVRRTRRAEISPPRTRDRRVSHIHPHADGGSGRDQSPRISNRRPARLTPAPLSTSPIEAAPGARRERRRHRQRSRPLHQNEPLGDDEAHGGGDLLLGEQYPIVHQPGAQIERDRILFHPARHSVGQGGVEGDLAP